MSAGYIPKLSDKVNDKLREKALAHAQRQDTPPRGAYMKYVLTKANGKKVDPEACYFVLRLDTDAAARLAVLTYADKCGNEELAHGIRVCVDELEREPCGCRSWDECTHEPLIDPVWRHGDKIGDNHV